MYLENQYAENRFSRRIRSKRQKSLLHAYPLSFDRCSGLGVATMLRCHRNSCKATKRHLSYGRLSICLSAGSIQIVSQRNWKNNMINSRSRRLKYHPPTGASDQPCVLPGRDGSVGYISGCAETRSNRRIHSRWCCSLAIGAVCKRDVLQDAMLTSMLLILARSGMTFEDHPNIKTYCEMIRASTDLSCSSLNCLCIQEHPSVPTTSPHTGLVPNLRTRS